MRWRAAPPTFSTSAASRPACSTRSIPTGRSPGVRIPFHVAGRHRSRTVTTQMFWDSDLGKTIETAAYCALPQAQSGARGQDRRGHRHVRQAAAARRLSLELVPAHRAGQALDQLARLPRALLRRPSDRGGGRLFPGDRQAQAARHYGALRRPHRLGVRPRAGQAQGLLRPRGDRARARQARPRDRGAEIPRSRQIFHRPARPAAALFRRRGARPRRRSQGLSLQVLRIQPVAQAGARAGQGRRPRRARDVSLFRHGRCRDRIWRRRACRSGARSAVGRSDLQAALCHRRARTVRRQRGLHRRLRPAQRDRLCRDLRRRRPGVLVEPHARHGPERALRRRDGAARSTTARSRASRSTAPSSSTKTRSRAVASIIAGNGIAAPAARPMSAASSRRSAATCTAWRTTRSPCISMATTPRGSRSPGARSS